jgi:hypothetical protein
MVLYEALTARVGDRDALLWQSPALGMTAQAFLLVIALGHDSSPAARCLAALLGIVVTFMSVQLMLKHRMYMTSDQLMMISLERRMGMPSSAIDFQHQIAYLKRDVTLPRLIKRARPKKYLTRLRSVDVWMWGLGLFGVINLALLIFSTFDAFGFPCSWTVHTVSGETRCVLSL